MKTSQKIAALVEWGVKPYRLARATGVPENTIRRVFKDVRKINKLRLENAEKLAAYYDLQVTSLIKAIVVCDELLSTFAPPVPPSVAYISLIKNPSLKLKTEPFSVYSDLRVQIEWRFKGLEYEEYLKLFCSLECSKCLLDFELDISDTITFPDDYPFIMQQELNEFLEHMKWQLNYLTQVTK